MPAAQSSACLRLNPQRACGSILSVPAAQSYLAHGNRNVTGRLRGTGVSLAIFVFRPVALAINLTITSTITATENVCELRFEIRARRSSLRW